MTCQFLRYQDKLSSLTLTSPKDTPALRPKFDQTNHRNNQKKEPFHRPPELPFGDLLPNFDDNQW